MFAPVFVYIGPKGTIEGLVDWDIFYPSQKCKTYFWQLSQMYVNIVNLKLY